MVFPGVSAFALFLVAVRIHLSIAASCTQLDWEWSHNSLGQDPCAVVEILEAKCQNLTSFDLQPLKAGQNYLTPQDGTATGCGCNTVTYSLYQACSQCQVPKSGNTWTFYDQFCTEVYVTQIPLDIPEDTEVPSWAYLNVTEENNFNSVAARALVENPKVFDSSPSLYMTSDAADPTPTAAANNKGAIIGAVVGGVGAIVLSATAFVIFSLLKKPMKRGEMMSRGNLEEEEIPLSAGPHSQSTITRDLPNDATYRQLSRSGVITAYDSSFYPKNVIAPSQNGYHGFAEV